MTDDDSDPKPTNVVIPALGENQIEAEINQWLVRSGDHVVKDQIILTMSLDKVDVELEAPADGVLVRTDLPGTIVHVGQVVARVEPPPPVDEALVARHDELLGNIVAAPGSYAARHEYAAFLMSVDKALPPWGAETARLRGRYIEADTRLYDRRSLTTPDMRRYEQVRKDLASVGWQTGHTLLGVPGRVEIDHGFVVGLTTTVDAFVEHHARIAKRAALRSITLSQLDVANLEWLVAVPRFPFIRTVTLLGDKQHPPPFGLFAKLAAAPVFAGIDKLVIEGYAIG